MAENPTALMQQLHDEHAAALWGFCLHLTGHDRSGPRTSSRRRCCGPGALRGARRVAAGRCGRGCSRSPATSSSTSGAPSGSQTESPSPSCPSPATRRDQTDQLLLSWVVAEALTRLSDDHRAVLLECYYRGSSVAEAARRLDVPEGTVKSRTHYALRALRLALEEMGVTHERHAACVTPTTTPPTCSARCPPRTGSSSSDTCRAAPSCAQSVRELAGLPGLLARVPVEHRRSRQLPIEPVPDTVLPALVAAYDGPAPAHLDHRRPGRRRRGDRGRRRGRRPLGGDDDAPPSATPTARQLDQHGPHGGPRRRWTVLMTPSAPSRSPAGSRSPRSAGAPRST